MLQTFPKKYLIASDFDSTLCQWPEGKVDDEDKAAIRRFREAGNIFVVVTGRTYQNTRWGFESTDFWDMDACFSLSGALCTRSDGTVIYDKRADGAYMGEIIEYFVNTKARYLAYDIGKECGVVDIGGEDRGLPSVSVAQALKFKSFTSLNAGYSDEKTAKARVAEIKERFGEVLTPLQNVIAIDMPPVGVNKASAVRYAAQMFGIEADNIYTVGDNYNDIDMVAEFHGCAVDSCPDELAAVAEYRVKRVKDVIKIIESKKSSEESGNVEI